MRTKTTIQYARDRLNEQLQKHKEIDEGAFYDEHLMGMLAGIDWVLGDSQEVIDNMILDRKLDKNVRNESVEIRKELKTWDKITLKNMLVMIELVKLKKFDDLEQVGCSRKDIQKLKPYRKYILAEFKKRSK